MNNTRSVLRGTQATLIFHHSVDELCAPGELPKYDFAEPVSSWEVASPRPYNEYPLSIIIRAVSLQNHRTNSYLIVPDNMTYATIEYDAQVLYDSRTEVPCDMVAFEAARARNRRAEA